ncbi:MAG: MOSC and FAD-binding oxidoreductase domain-containing protein [Actinomycetota bacterium]
MGRLVSVNVGLPRDVQWRARTVHTGVWKRAVEGPRMVRKLNIDGDGQGDLAGHGGPHRAVLVYQLASYEHWRQFFGRDDFDWGEFGENFTVEGLPDDEVCIGDQYQIGEALFEVSAPRVTCYRVGLRLGEPRLPALLVSHHRPGFYFRVIREGVVEAGTPILKVRTGPEQMSVSDVDALLYLPGHDRAEVDRALRIPALSPGWKGSFQTLSGTEEGVTGNAGLNEASGEAPAAWPGFRPVHVAEVVAETESVVSLRLEATDGHHLPDALPGQFVVLRLDLADGQPPASRSYSLSGPPGAPGYRVSVKREPGGAFSSFVHTKLRPGSVLEMSAPRGQFTLAAEDAPVLLVSAGIGATPVLSMLHAMVRDRATRAVWWLHAARNSTEHAFATEAGELLAQLPDARIQICYSSPLPTDTLGKQYTHRGRLDAEFLSSLSLPIDALAYTCGPGVFMDDVRAALTRTGLAPANIHSEVFGAAPSITPGIAAGPAKLPHPPAGEEGGGPSVTFSRSRLTVPWRAEFASVLELAEACDVPTRWSCRTGICHTCETGLLAGAVSYEPAPIDLPADGQVLVCCAAPDDDIVLDL